MSETDIERGRVLQFLERMADIYSHTDLPSASAAIDAMASMIRQGAHIDFARDPSQYPLPSLAPGEERKP